MFSAFKSPLPTMSVKGILPSIPKVVIRQNIDIFSSSSIAINTANNKTSTSCEASRSNSTSSLFGYLAPFYVSSYETQLYATARAFGTLQNTGAFTNTHPRRFLQDSNSEIVIEKSRRSSPSSSSPPPRRPNNPNSNSNTFITKHNKRTPSRSNSNFGRDNAMRDFSRIKPLSNEILESLNHVKATRYRFFSKEVQSILRDLSQQGDMSSLWTIADLYAKDLTIQNYTFILYNLYKHKLYREVIDLFDVILAQDHLSVDIRVLEVILCSYCHLKQVPAAERFLAQMVSRGYIISSDVADALSVMYHSGNSNYSHWRMLQLFHQVVKHDVYVSGNVLSNFLSTFQALRYTNVAIQLAIQSRSLRKRYLSRAIISQFINLLSVRGLTYVSVQLMVASMRGNIAHTFPPSFYGTIIHNLSKSGHLNLAALWAEKLSIYDSSLSPSSRLQIASYVSNHEMKDSKNQIQRASPVLGMLMDNSVNQRNANNFTHILTGIQKLALPQASIIMRFLMETDSQDLVKHWKNIPFDSSHFMWTPLLHSVLKNGTNEQDVRIFLQLFRVSLRWPRIADYLTNHVVTFLSVCADIGRPDLVQQIVNETTKLVGPQTIHLIHREKIRAILIKKRMDCDAEYLDIMQKYYSTNSPVTEVIEGITFNRLPAEDMKTLDRLLGQKVNISAEISQLLDNSQYDLSIFDDADINNSYDEKIQQSKSEFDRLNTMFSTHVANEYIISETVDAVNTTIASTTSTPIVLPAAKSITNNSLDRTREYFGLNRSLVNTTPYKNYNQYRATGKLYTEEEAKNIKNVPFYPETVRYIYPNNITNSQTIPTSVETEAGAEAEAEAVATDVGVSPIVINKDIHKQIITSVLELEKATGAKNAQSKLFLEIIKEFSSMGSPMGVLFWLPVFHRHIELLLSGADSVGLDPSDRLIFPKIQQDLSQFDNNSFRMDSISNNSRHRGRGENELDGMTEEQQQQHQIQNDLDNTSNHQKGPSYNLLCRNSVQSPLGLSNIYAGYMPLLEAVRATLVSDKNISHTIMSNTLLSYFPAITKVLGGVGGVSNDNDITPTLPADSTFIDDLLVKIGDDKTTHRAPPSQPFSIESTPEYHSYKRNADSEMVRPTIHNLSMPYYTTPDSVSFYPSHWGTSPSSVTGISSYSQAFKSFIKECKHLYPAAPKLDAIPPIYNVTSSILESHESLVHSFVKSGHVREAMISFFRYLSLLEKYFENADQGKLLYRSAKIIGQDSNIINDDILEKYNISKDDATHALSVISSPLQSSFSVSSSMDTSTLTPVVLLDDVQSQLTQREDILTVEIQQKLQTNDPHSLGITPSTGTKTMYKNTVTDDSDGISLYQIDTRRDPIGFQSCWVAIIGLLSDANQNRIKCNPVELQEYNTWMKDAIDIIYKSWTLHDVNFDIDPELLMNSLLLQSIKTETGDTSSNSSDINKERFIARPTPTSSMIAAISGYHFSTGEIHRCDEPFQMIEYVDHQLNPFTLLNPQQGGLDSQQRQVNPRDNDSNNNNNNSIGKSPDGKFSSIGKENPWISKLVSKSSMTWRLQLHYLLELRHSLEMSSQPTSAFNSFHDSKIGQQLFHYLSTANTALLDRLLESKPDNDATEFTDAMVYLTQPRLTFDIGHTDSSQNPRFKQRSSLYDLLNYGQLQIPPQLKDKTTKKMIPRDELAFSLGKLDRSLTNQEILIFKNHIRIIKNTMRIMSYLQRTGTAASIDVKNEDVHEVILSTMAKITELRLAEAQEIKKKKDQIYDNLKTLL